MMTFNATRYLCSVRRTAIALVVSLPTLVAATQAAGADAGIQIDPTSAGIPGDVRVKPTLDPPCTRPVIGGFPGSGGSSRPPIVDHDDGCCLKKVICMNVVQRPSCGCADKSAVQVDRSRTGGCVDSRAHLK